MIFTLVFIGLLIFTLISVFGSINDRELTINSQVLSNGKISGSIGLNILDPTGGELRALNWGNMTPGKFITRDILVNNTGELALTLKLVGYNWKPESAASFLDLTWNYNGRALAFNETVLLTLKLFVSPNIQGIDVFNVEILVSGTN